MPGFGDADAVTPGRRTRARFNRFLPQVLVPYLAIGHNSGQMMQGSKAKQLNVEYIPGIGIRLKRSLEDSRLVWEKGEVREHTSSNATYASNMLRIPLNRQFTDTGLTYTDTDASAGYVHQKQIPAGSTWANSLSADATAFPPPTAPAGSPLDRVMATSDVHEPDDTAAFWVYVPGAGANIGAFAQLYFSGPAGGNEEGVGIGQYCLRVFGDGVAVLFEKLVAETATWLERFRFDISPKMESGAGFTVQITSNAAQEASGAWVGNTVAFVVAQAPGAQTKGRDPAGVLVDTLASKAIAAITRHSIIYDVPTDVAAVTTPAPIRIDLRRDARIMFWSALSSYATTGKIVDEVIHLPYAPVGTGADFLLDVYCARPTGTTVTASMVDVDTGTPLTLTDVQFDGMAGFRAIFTVPANDSTRYSVQLSMTGSGTKTPTVKSWQLYREPVMETPTPDEIVIDDVRPVGPALATLFLSSEAGMSIDSQTEAAAADSATFVVEDLTGQQIPLRWRTGTPVQVEVTDEAGTLLSTVFQGIVGSTSVETYGRDGKDYPNEDATRITVMCTGEWTRFSRKLAPNRLSLVDPDGQPMRIDDVLRVMFYLGGYLVDNVAIQDYPIRMFSADDAQALSGLEPSSRICDFTHQVLEDYIGGTLVWCPNSGTSNGMWRLIRKPVPPYNVLMRFHREHPGTGKLAHVLGSYPTTTTANGQVVAPSYMVKGTMATRYEPPEGNVVTVFGGGDNGAQYLRTLYNVVSYNALAVAEGDPGYPDPESPDYLGEAVPIHVYDGTLRSQAAVDWVARRVFDVGCFGREYLSFEAPARYVLDITDEFQTQYRLLRFGDVVEAQQPDGTWRTYMVTKCALRYNRDNMQMMQVELGTATNFDRVGLIPSAFDLHSLTRARIKQAKRAMGEPTNDRPLSSINRLWKPSGVQPIRFLPTVDVIPPLQDLVPSSPTFGTFYFMEGYDPETEP